MTRISIVICTRNRGDRLAGTLRSLEAIETKVVWEVLLVDNASTDDTAEIIHAHCETHEPSRYLLATDVGLGAARDTAWRAARGEIVCFTDDDCYLEPDFVDAMDQAYRAYPQIGGLGGRIMLFDPTDARVTIDERSDPSMFEANQFVPPGQFHGANLSFRRTVLDEIGGFDRKLGAGTPFPSEDIDVCAAVIHAGYPMRFDPRPVVSHHHGRKDADVPALQLNYRKGRGAYFAKYIGRSDTRLDYLKGWWWSVKGGGKTKDDVFGLRQEIRSGLSYLHATRSWLIMPLYLAFGVIFLTLVWGSSLRNRD